MKLPEKTYSDAIKEKLDFFENFWQGKGSFPILFTKPHFAREKVYLKHNLVEQHNNVDKLLKENILETTENIDMLDDGIPVIRPDLGTTLLPSGLGLEITVQPEQQPWIRNHYSIEEAQTLPSKITPEYINKNELAMAYEFYGKFSAKQSNGEIRPDIMPYVADTQGVFDLSHLLLGNDIFYLISDNPEVLKEIQEKSTELFIAGTTLMKNAIGESLSSMIHGHGMHSGVWFPDTGARISEDSCTLISEEMIKDFCLPYIKEAIKPFNRGFMHFCGHHVPFLKMICELEEISTINLGNPEKYDIEELFKILGETKTVYFGHFATENNEDSKSYLERMASYCEKNNARLILVSGYFPKNIDEKISMVEYWHKLTRKL